MSVLGSGRRWIRRRRAERLRRRARSSPPSNLDDAVAACERILAAGDGAGTFEAVEALTAVARSGEDHPVRDRATDALLSVATDRNGSLQASALRSLRYVAIERDVGSDGLDDAVADAVDQWDHPDHRRIAVDAGMLLADDPDDSSQSTGRGAEAPVEAGPDRDPDRGESPESPFDFPATRERLHEALVAGPPAVRENAAVAYVVAAGKPDRFEHREEILEHLAIVGGSTDDELPPPGSTARQFADGRTIDDAIDAFSRSGTR